MKDCVASICLELWFLHLSLYFFHDALHLQANLLHFFPQNFLFFQRFIKEAFVKFFGFEILGLDRRKEKETLQKQDSDEKGSFHAGNSRTARVSF